MKKFTHLLILLFITTIVMGQSVSLDGFNDYLYVKSDASLQTTDAMTVEAWIKADAWQSVVYKGTVVSNGNNTEGNNGFDLRAGANGKAEFNIAIDGSWKVVTSNEIMELGEWNHIAGVYDGEYIRVFVNGVERSTLAATGTINDFQKYLYIGESPGWNLRVFDGLVDEVRYWNVGLTAEQIRSNIADELNGDEAGLIGYWKMNEGEGDSIFDATTNNNHAKMCDRMVVEQAWHENFVCEFNDPDIGVTSLVEPNSSMELTNEEEVTIKISNFSLQEATNIKAGFTLNNGAQVSETLTESIEPLGVLDYTFTQTVDLSIAGNYDFVFDVFMPGDVKPENDILQATISSFDESSNFSVAFDGVDDKIVIPHNDALCPESALTVEAWINADEWKQQQWAGTIVSKDGDEDDGASGYVLRTGANGVLEFVVTAPGWNGCASAPVMKTNKWYHVAGVYNGETIKVYINGSLQNTTSANSSLNTSAFPLQIGECSGFPNRVFDGKIDEVRIWDVARTASEIQANMKDELNGDEEGLVAYYKMNDGLGNTTVDDNSGNDNGGTLENIDISIAWGSGFEITTKDVGVVGIASPVNGPTFTSSEIVKIEVQNFAFEEISNFDISYVINDESVVTETITETIPAFTSIIYAFEIAEDLSSFDELTITAYTELEGDVDANNDSFTTQIIESDRIILFNEVQHNFSAEGQTHSTEIYLPENLDNYSQVLLHLSLACPTYGCDPWDQFANITMKKDGLSYEIARYITPYGREWEQGWTYDISDFRELLVGKVSFTSFIMVWGPNGWLVNASLELVEGTPEYKHVKVKEFINLDYLVYGDPNVSYDIEEATFQIPDNTDDLKVRLTHTGHGQGNTYNAAEFYETYHYLNINGTDSMARHLWKDDCDVNECSPQSGTWEYPRAGWCPGQDVQPYYFDLVDHFTAGSSITLDYRLQEYLNLNNTGYNDQGHTEPHYKIKAYVVMYSDEPFVSVNDEALGENKQIKVYPNPSKGNIFINSNQTEGNINISVFDINGRILNSTMNKANGGIYEIDMNEQAKGIYFIRITTDQNTEVHKLVVE
jgi:Concanavalin A-like lectin/glucanases superfamily/Peptide-N-glycosidase F, C terminal/Secretion system C-terminal sorting domain